MVKLRCRWVGTTLLCFFSAGRTTVAQTVGQPEHVNDSPEYTVDADRKPVSLASADGEAIELWIEKLRGDPTTRVMARISAPEGTFAEPSFPILQGGTYLALYGVRKRDDLNIVVFQWSGGFTSDLYALRSSDGGRNWSQAQLILPANPDDVISHFQLLGGKQGQIMVVYGLVHRSEIPSSVMCIHSADGGATWSPPEVVADAAYGESAALSLDASIAYVVTRRETEIPQVFFSRRSSDGGATWSDPAVVAVETSGEMLGYPTVLGGLDGYLYVFFGKAVPGVGQTIELTRSSDSGLTYEPRRSLTSSPSWVQKIAGVTTQGDDVHVAWFRQESDGVWSLHYNVSHDRALTFRSKDILLIEPQASHYIFSIDIGLDLAGNLYTVWDERSFREPQSVDRIAGVVSTDDGGTFSPILLLDWAPVGQTKPQLSMRQSSALVSWLISDRFGNSDLYHATVSIP